MNAVKSMPDLLTARRPKPEKKGVVYLLFSGLEIVYVGQTRDLYARLRSHDKRIPYDSYAVVDAASLTEWQRRELEAAYIKRFNPRLNRVCGPARRGVAAPARRVRQSASVAKARTPNFTTRIDPAVLDLFRRAAAAWATRNAMRPNGSLTSWMLSVLILAARKELARTPGEQP